MWMDALLLLVVLVPLVSLSDVRSSMSDKSDQTSTTPAFEMPTDPAERPRPIPAP